MCPLGAAYAVIGSQSLVRVKHNHENCTNCMDCKVVCPENQVLHMINKSSIAVSDGECTNCGRCVDVCNDDALGFGIRAFTKNVNIESNKNS